MEKQQKLMQDEPPCKFQVVFAKNFYGLQWIPVKVTKVTDPLSYHVETDSEITLHCHVDHL